MWFAANLFFRGRRSNDRSGADDLWEERIVLVAASGETEARAAAEQIAKKEEHEYCTDSASGDRLRWTFSKIERVFPIGEVTLSHGTELFSRFLRRSEVESLLRPFDDSEPFS